MSLRITKDQLEMILKHLALYDSDLIIFEGVTDSEIQESLENFSSKPEHKYQHEAPKGVM